MDTETLVKIISLGTGHKWLALAIFVTGWIGALARKESLVPLLNIPPRVMAPFVGGIGILSGILLARQDGGTWTNALITGGITAFGSGYLYDLVVKSIFGGFSNLPGFMKWLALIPHTPSDSERPPPPDRKTPTTLSGVLIFIGLPLALAARYLLVAAITLGLTMTGAGCAAVASILPDVIAAVQDGVQILDAIERFCTMYFTQHPNADAQAKVAEAMAKTRAALNVALRASQGAKDLDDKQLAQAFAEFEQAYVELLALVRPYGVSEAIGPSNMALRSPGPGQLVVPHPIAFSLHAKKGK